MKNLGRAEIARAVPPASRRARSQPEALLALPAHPDLTGLRADYARNICEVWRRLVRSAAPWAHMTVLCPREQLCAELGISVSTWKRCRAWIEAHGYLGCVVAGSTPELDGMRTSPALVDKNAPNTAAVYVLTIPRKKQALPPPPPAKPVTEPPTPLPEGGGRSHARARQDHGPGSRPGSLPAMAEQLRKGPGQGITNGWAAWLARRFADAEWTAGDLGYAINHDPGGDQHRGRLDRVAHPVGWLRWRLGRWLGEDDTPLPSRSQQAATARERLRADQQSRRERMQAMAAAWVDPAPRAAAIREQLAGQRRKR